VQTSVPYVPPVSVQVCIMMPEGPRGPYSGKPSNAQPIWGECSEDVWPNWFSKQLGGTWQWYDASVVLDP